ncbi:cbb3-type cytochrome oxidase assembly protein CcoS [Pseudoruegeria sp. SK021]|uniref:cbb3-type cytochrome oxidase assembly protein CcoS n=1 Tax=Pseudoruegeria sp. SK021 TaxID=1933035 RepID=UPI000A23A3D3|nr:cbb3-type cytochrome oxidase assembly protein CcoS [Pseudoruegeria sp. SK021]OSP54108.1 cytochrome oxidase maturation protein, cbb3-type [Pseudoruegeria sp. SK021]
MTILIILIPVTLSMGAFGLAAFFWSLRNGQYEDLSGDAERILHDDDVPLKSLNSTSRMIVTKETKR